jgi:hypothetical protein
LEGSRRGRSREPTWLVFRCTHSLRGVGIPQSYHFPQIYVATCIRMLRGETCISDMSPSSHTCDNTLESLGRRAGNSHDGSTRGDLGLHGVVRTMPYRTRSWPLGWRGTPWRLIFFSYHKKCLFHFQSTEIGFFVKQLPKREIGSWEKHPT